MDLDVKQTDNAYIIRVEIPGVDKDNLHVEIDDSMHAVTITSEVVRTLCLCQHANCLMNN
eukprot:4474-Heterococcus_DN1.PRE.7